ncbi:hypothetical protein EMCRGX_G007138 [Ephydatia muelleri]
MSYPALGLSDVLCLPAKKKDFSDTTVLSHFRRVAYVEDFYYILHRVHCQERGHVGYKKTLAEISACYECLPRSAVQKFVSLCPLCSSQKLQHNQAAEAHHSFRVHEQRPSRPNRHASSP